MNPSEETLTADDQTLVSEISSENKKKQPSELFRSHRSVVRTHVAEAVVAEKRRRINILQPSSSPSRTAVLEPPEVCD